MAGRFVPCLPLHPFPRRCKILDAGNHSVQQMCLQLLSYSRCLFCFVDMKDHQMVQSAVRSDRTVVRFYPLHGRKWSLTDCFSSRLDKEHFFRHNDLGTKSSLLHLAIAQTPPVLSHCQSTWEPPAAPSTSPLWSNFKYNWRTSPKCSSNSSPCRECKNNSCIFLNMIQSVCLDRNLTA